MKIEINSPFETVYFNNEVSLFDCGDTILNEKFGVNWGKKRLHLFIPPCPSTTLSMVPCRPSARPHLYIHPYPVPLCLVYGALPALSQATSLHPSMSQYHSVWSMVLCRPSARLHLFIPPCPSTTLSGLWCPAGPQPGYTSTSIHT